MAELEKRFSGSVPENYDRGLGPYIFAYYAQEMARRCASLAPASVLETAAGTGIVTEQLRLQLSPGCGLTATDLNQGMIDYAQGKIAHPGIDFAIADGCALPLADTSFDAMVCQFGVMFYPDKHAGFTEALRVLKPGGTYLFSVWDNWAANRFAQTAYDAGAEFFPGDPPAFYKAPFSYHDRGEIKRAVLAAGFGECTIEALPHSQPIDDAAHFANGLVHGNPLHSELVERGIDPQPVIERIEQGLRQNLGGTLELQALFVAARKQ